MSHDHSDRVREMLLNFMHDICSSMVVGYFSNCFLPYKTLAIDPGQMGSSCKSISWWRIDNASLVRGNLCGVESQR